MDVDFVTTVISHQEIVINLTNFFLKQLEMLTLRITIMTSIKHMYSAPDMSNLYAGIFIGSYLCLDATAVFRITSSLQ